MSILEESLRPLSMNQEKEAAIIPWACPVLSFGNYQIARIATVGINPSNREFTDNQSRHLAGENRRLHTLQSLNLNSWRDATNHHFKKILESQHNYFSINPYKTWFDPLDKIIKPTGFSYYETERHSCHLDISPYATTIKWSSLSTAARRNLLKISSPFLPAILKSSNIEIIVLNGSTATKNFQKISDISFNIREEKSWALPRKGEPVSGYSFEGTVTEIFGQATKKQILVLGFNHNIQSSFGVTLQVRESISQWIDKKTKGRLQ